MSRDELVERVTYIVPGYVVPSDVAEAILELFENELALAGIRPPWFTERHNCKANWIGCNCALENSDG